jgi:2-oxoglutarate dehydrogenase E2 component (dihydrolipoamide succinyltransferase)
MATEVTIPAMGESISSGILAVWHVKDGDYVEKDQPIYELETDKITSEANAEVAGIISLKVAVDDEVDIGQVVASIDESATAPGASAAPASAAPAAPAAQAVAAPVEAAPATLAAAAPVAAAAAAVAVVGAATGTQHPLSPAARKAAAETGVNTSNIAGSGKDGRVTKSDILAVAAAPAAVAAPVPVAATPEAAPVAVDPATRETRKKMSPLRRKIAERLVAATQECALLTTFNEVDMSSVMKLRKQHQEKFVERHGIKLGFMSFFTKAVTHALQACPPSTHALKATKSSLNISTTLASRSVPTKG